MTTTMRSYERVTQLVTAVAFRDLDTIKEIQAEIDQSGEVGNHLRFTYYLTGRALLSAPNGVDAAIEVLTQLNTETVPAEFTRLAMMTGFLDHIADGSHRTEFDVKETTLLAGGVLFLSRLAHRNGQRWWSQLILDELYTPNAQ